MAVPAQAQSQAFNIPRGKLKNAIDAYARQTGRQVIYKADEIANAHSRGVSGNISPDEARAKLLQGTGFSDRTDASGEIAIVSGEAIAVGAAAVNQSADIVCTGTMIGGLEHVSPVACVTRQDVA